MYCKYYTVRSKKGIKYSYCRLLKREITLSYCQECDNKGYKRYKTMKSRSSKQAKLERNRFSILTNDLDHCIVCGAKKDHLHEIFFGRNRTNSIKHGLVIPLCSTHHIEMHKNKEWQDYWHVVAQKRFIEYYHKSIDEFIEIFKINYL